MKIYTNKTGMLTIDLEGYEVGALDESELSSAHKGMLAIQNGIFTRKDSDIPVPAELSTKESSTHEPETKAWFPLDSIQSEPTSPSHVEITGMFSGEFTIEEKYQSPHFTFTYPLDHYVKMGDDFSDEYGNIYSVSKIIQLSPVHLRLILELKYKSDLFLRILTDFQPIFAGKNVYRMATLSKNC